MNKKLIAFAALVFAVVLTSFSVSGTYAKYTETYTGLTDTAKIAKWDIKLDGAKATNSLALDLFDADDKSVAATDGEDLIIAPGSEGEGEFVFTNNSDVDAVLDIKLSGGQVENVPIKYTVTVGETALSEVEDLTSIDWSTAAEALKIAKTNGSVTVKVAWKWAYGQFANNAGHDTEDTQAGVQSAIANRTSLTITANVTATQAEVK